ncbi:hypothetical protein IGJ22_000675 [Enterococcus sp. DIV0448]|uniref:hypothetical protein n=1 Tax=Enterococcus TaxID=1350 RepID=UPI0029532D77|nr:hypothetical protein [Enterococcus hirae]MDV7801482.1 hypothetical protein [Enterococcus hirae]
MNEFDSLGARQLPKEKKAIATDWQGNPLYLGDSVYSIEGEYVREDDLQNFIEQNIGEPMDL